jgi:transposase-like protein
MQLRLHANATTTPRTRGYIQQSAASQAALARELGIHPRTVARWKARGDVADRSTRPHRLATPITAWEEALIVELRRSLVLPLDDIVEAMRRCLNRQLSRSGVHRCLKRHGLSARLTAQQAPAVAFQTDTPAGFIHIDVKYLPPLGRRRSYAYSLPQRRLGLRSTAPPALSISKSCPIAAAPPPPLSSPASSTVSRSRSIPS